MRSNEDHLFGGAAKRSCRAVVIIPARNEEENLPRALRALQRQVDRRGLPLEMSCYEVLLLLNNCTDDSCEVALHFREAHPDLNLHVAHAELSSEVAHVGTARRMLMDAAFARLSSTGRSDGVILSTDADTEVAPDWISQNLREIDHGADVVGGVIRLFRRDLRELAASHPDLYLAYRRDRTYQRMVARLASLLDPDPYDPWPRHLEHFGASLACTAEIYQRAGGLPAVNALEDVAFVDALRRIEARIRHSRRVRVHTSARLDGRAKVGLSGQLRLWQRDAEEGAPHVVDSAAWLVHRFRSLGALRRACETECTTCALREIQAGWQESFAELHMQDLPFSQFCERFGADRYIAESFDGERRGEISDVLKELRTNILEIQSVRRTWSRLSQALVDSPAISS